MDYVAQFLILLVAARVMGRLAIRLHQPASVGEIAAGALLALLAAGFLAPVSWIAGLPPIHKKVGALGTALLSPLTGPLFPVHLIKGGSHAATHALVKAATAYGVKILPSCPVEKILVRDGKARGVTLSEHAVYGGETITSDTVVSNVTVAPTFLRMIGEEHIGQEMAYRISQFSYDEQNLFAVYYAHRPIRTI